MWRHVHNYRLTRRKEIKFNNPLIFFCCCVFSKQPFCSKTRKEKYRTFNMVFKKRKLSFQLWQVFHWQVIPHVLIFKGWRVNFILWQCALRNAYNYVMPEIHAAKHTDKFVEMNKVYVQVVEFCRGALNFCPECRKIHLRECRISKFYQEERRGDAWRHPGPSNLVIWFVNHFYPPAKKCIETHAL